MKLLAALVLPAVLVLGIAYAETRLVADSSPPSYTRARGVVWAGRTFVDRAQLARWLRSRGVRYQVWAQRHPALAGITPRRQAAQAVRRAEANGADHRPTWMSATLVGGAAALAVLFLVFVLRNRRLARWRGRILSAFPRPRGARGVAVRLWGRRDRPVQREAGGSRGRRRSSRTFGKPGRPLGVVTALGPVLVLRARRWQHRARAGLPAAQRGHADLRAAAAAAGGARLIRRWGAAAGLLLSTRATAAAFTFRRRRGELGWYLATALLAVGTGLLVTAWLNGA